MRKLSPAQKRDLVLACPRVVRTGPHSYTRPGEESYPRRLHAMYSLFYPKQFVSIRALSGWVGYRLEYHEIGTSLSFGGKGWDVGIACPIQSTTFEWAQELALFVAKVVAQNTARLEEISDCVSSQVPDYKGRGPSVFYVPNAWSREYKESLFPEFAEFNAYMAQAYTEHAAWVEANPNCTSLQVQQQLDRVAAFGGLRPELAAKWRAKGDARLL
jgi:hypothetical protein